MIQTLESDLQTARSDLANAQTTLEEVKKQYNLLQGNYDWTVERAKETEKQSNQYQSEVAQMKGALLAAQDQQKQAIDTLATLRASNLVLQSDKDRSESSLATLSTKYATLNTRHLELETDNKKLEASIESLRVAQSKAQGEAQKNKDAYQKSLSAAEEKLKTFHETLRTRNAEIQRLQSELKKPESSTSTVSPSTEEPTRLMSSEDYLGGHRQTLRHAPVNEELRRIAEIDSAGKKSGKYRLGATIETAQFPWEHPNKPSPFTKSGAQMRKARRNGYETDSEDSEGSMGEEQSGTDSDEDDEDDKTERDDHVIRKRWEGLGRRRKWTAREQGVNAAELVRAILLTFFGCKHLYEAFALPQVDDERLKLFREGDEAAKARYGPKLRNSRLDKRGMTTATILESEWNQMVMFRLAGECTEIASRTKDARFGKEIHDWNSMIRKRLQPILKTHLEAKPKFNGEPVELRIGRVAQRYRKIKATSKANNILYTKYHVRASIATIMIQAMRERDDQEGLAMWQYVLNCLHRLQHEGMSDEESGEDDVVVSGEKSRVQLRKVLVLVWRHPAFKDLFALVDSTREAEASIFSQQGRPRLLRIRVDKDSSNSRIAPKHLPKSFFRPEWLAEMGKFPFKIDALKLSSKDFPLRVITNLPDLDA